MLAAAFASPAGAGANVVAAAGIDFPDALTVGQFDVPASIVLTNANTGADAGAENFICNPDASTMPPECAGEDGILFTPSCTVVSGDGCATPDPNALGVSTQLGGDLFVIGRSGLADRRADPEPGACPGGFSVDEVEGSGTYRIHPQHWQTLTLAPGASCFIRLYVTVNNPPVDADGGTPGLQTRQILSHAQHSASGVSPVSTVTTTTTVSLSSAARITGRASKGGAVGNAIYDTATIHDLVGANSGGTVTFRLYSPSDPGCSGAPVFTDVAAAITSGRSGNSVSNVFFPTQTGIYRWTATYDGDTRNLPTPATACGAANQTVEMTPGPQKEQPPGTPPPPAAKKTGKRAQAVKRCWKGKSKKRIKKCLRRAQRLPV